ARGLSADPVGLLRVCGGADFAAMAGFCAQAAVRRTPVLLDGVVVTAAALVADRLAPGAREWWQAGHRSTEPAHTLALKHLELEPIIDMRMRLGEAPAPRSPCPSCAPPSPRSRRWPRSTRRASPRDPLGHRRIRVCDRPARARLSRRGPRCHHRIACRGCRTRGAC